jgi:hypothetical protein
MSTAVESSIARIGETAGVLWHLLDEKGPLPLTKLLKECDEPRDLVMQAIGWLAREDKIQMDDESRNKTISLK